ncbi:hypothetical protein SAMN05444362_12220 [Dysgonomonas macrotermitis]|uniref:Uncharacterized protein n=1 Tax=Dysgonomonas macrotermitis TaxID=1346286 RepID=A0A1M5J786_9BACT|nr:hypothetical protein SAMN05444362_12220 [Dysgonomonas macrotermitis]
MNPATLPSIGYIISNSNTHYYCAFYNYINNLHFGNSLG